MHSVRGSRVYIRRVDIVKRVPIHSAVDRVHVRMQSVPLPVAVPRNCKAAATRGLEIVDKVVFVSVCGCPTDRARNNVDAIRGNRDTGTAATTLPASCIFELIVLD